MTEPTDKIVQIIQAYRQLHGPSLNDFAQALGAGLPEIRGRRPIAGMTISHWENGRRLTDYRTFCAFVVFYDEADWQYQFGHDVLAALVPESIAPAGEIGKRILGEEQE